MPEPPLALLCELTHRCPLRCLYCSNPIELAPRQSEMSPDAWAAALDAAAHMGVLQAHFSGGEPLLFEGLDGLVARARAAGLYTNLITSGWGLDAARARRLSDAGLDHAQVSFQDSDRAAARAVAGAEAFDAKLTAARAVRDVGIALSANLVMHRGNLARVGEMIDMAAELGAARVEVASAQYHGWALKNRAALLGPVTALAAAGEVARERRARYAGRMDVIYVLPDYVTDFPKPCMDGWGRRSLTIAPDGRVLPCPGATCIAGMSFDDVRDRPLQEIWERGAAFEAFRGEAWMPEPCISCDRRALDYGGCRCQAFALTGDARRTDPACAKAPDHGLVLRAREDAGRDVARLPVYRELVANKPD